MNQSRTDCGNAQQMIQLMKQDRFGAAASLNPIGILINYSVDNY